MQDNYFILENIIPKMWKIQQKTIKTSVNFILVIISNSFLHLIVIEGFHAIIENQK